MRVCSGLGLVWPTECDALAEYENLGHEMDPTVAGSTCQTSGSGTGRQGRRLPDEPDLHRHSTRAGARRWDDAYVSRPDRAVFRLPVISVLIPFLAFVCITPLANAGPTAFLAFYLFPLAALVYILITRTVADPTSIRASGPRGVRRIAWSDLDGLEFRGPRWATAVGLDGRRIRLPMVRPRDMYRLAAVSGGRLLIGKDAPTPEPEDGDPEADEAPGTDHATGGVGGAVASGPEESVRTPAGAVVDDE